MFQDLIIKGRPRDLGGFSVVRSLPSGQKRTVGPFVFLDHMGPLTVDETHLLDVRPHPHIGLSTVTYLFSGEGFHRDSLGSAQIIRPGELNWMTAGRGIVHSERTPSEELKKNPRPSLHGIQIWVALPVEHEKSEPHFQHYPSEVLPKVDLGSHFTGKLLIGEYKGIRSPVKTFSRTFFLEAIAHHDVQREIQIEEEEIGLFLIEGIATVNNQKLAKDDLIVLANPQKIQLQLSRQTKIVFIGGTPFPEPRYIWWNFVSSNKEAIHEAAELWKNQKMGQVPTETDFIPLPNEPLP